MTGERDSNPQIDDPQGFLARPFTEIEIGTLVENPTLDFLKWLPTIPEETGLVYIAPKWAVIKASKRGVPSWTMPKYSDVLIHSHPGGTEFFLPSPQDIMNCSPTAKNLIISSGGVTQYCAQDSMSPEELQLLQRRMAEDNPDKDDVYLAYKFLERVGIQYSFTSWEEMDQETLDVLLYENLHQY